MRTTLLATIIAASLLSLGGTAYADDDPPNRTGCCFSFDDSPVNIVFCNAADACKFQNPPK